MNKFKAIRVDLSYTLDEMATLLGISTSLYKKLEYGYRKPSNKVLQRFKEQKPYIDTNIFFNNEVLQMRTLKKSIKEVNNNEKS